MKSALASMVLGPLAFSGPSATTGATGLRITVWPQGRSVARVSRYTLSCAPARGTLPRPARACAVLARLGTKAFAPVPADVACSDIYGGPEQAWVRGTLAGHRVDARLDRTNGCQVDRWNKVAQVVPRS